MPYSERTEAALTRMRDFLNGRTRGPLISLYHQPDYRQQPDHAVLVARACEVIRADRASGQPDVVPTFFPDFGTVSTAALFGGKRIPPGPNGRLAHIERAVQTVDELLALKPCPFEESDFQRGLDLYRQVCARLGTDEVFLRTPDFQGALNTLALMIDQTELMVAMMEQPDLIKTVLGRITDTLIEYVARYRKEAGPGKVVGSIWPYIVLPDGIGVSLTQDYMPLLGPEQYAEFELPLLKRIADRFGGVHIHCCGKYKQHLPALAASGIKIWGLETHYPETTVEDIYAVFGDTVAITPYIAPNGAQEFPTLPSLIRSWKGKPHARARFWFASCLEWGDAADLRRAIADVCG
jgi:hypothetical protein